MLNAFLTPSSISIIVAAVVSFIFGWIWYSPMLFGNAWMKYSRKSSKEIEKAKSKNMGKTIFIALLSQIVMSWILAMFIYTLGVDSLGFASLVAFMIWLGFVATIGIGMVLWDGKPMALFWINTIHWLITLLIQAIIISAWM